MNEFTRRKLIARLGTLLLVFIVLFVGIGIGSLSNTIQKPNEQVTITLANGVLVDDVKVVSWTSNTLNVTVESPKAITGILTLTTDNHGYATFNYALTQPNLPIWTVLTLNASLLNANSLTIKT